MNILFIEPDAILAKSFKNYFSKDYKVRITPSAGQAIDLADELTPDVIVMELQLKHHNGIDFLYEFRSYIDWQDVPIIIYTIVPPDEFPSDKSFWSKLNVQEYLYKPTTKLSQLNSRINDLIPIETT